MMRRVFLLFCLIAFFSSCKKKERYLVISKIQSASKLATTETTIDKVVFGVQDKKLLWIIRLNEARFFAYTKATIWTGIDLTELSPSDVDIDGRKINIMLPSVKVLEFQYPFSSYRIDSSITENAFLNKMDIKDHEYFYQQAELEIRNNINRMGIRKETENRTRTLLTGLLKNLDYEEIYIKFRKEDLMEPLKLPQEDSAEREVEKQ